MISAGSWVCHGTIATVAPHVLRWALAWVDWEWSAWGLASPAAAFYTLRELGDMWFHEFRLQDADEIDHDEDWQGRQVRGVSPKYDGWADWLVPFFASLNFALGGS